MLARGPKIATWLLALILGVQAALLVTDLAGGVKSPAASAGAAPAVQPAARRRTNVAVIANAHLFGAHAAPASADPANAPQTDMRLVLTGVIAGEDPSTGVAILGESASSAKVYGTGDTLPGGAKLHAVYADRVILDRNGQLESLPLPHQFSAGSGSGVAMPVASEDDDNPPVERVRRLIAEQPGAVSEIMRPQPVFAQGKQKGYRVYPGRNRQAFVRLGLRPGDLVTAINGTPLDDPSRGQEIFQTLSSASEARVTVMRNGRQQDLSLNMSQVAQQAQALSDEGGAGEPEEPQLQVPDESATNPPDSDE